MKKKKDKQNHQRILEIWDTLDPTEREELIHSLLKERPQDPDEDYKPATWGDRIADRLATVAGSWPFIISFCLLLAVWICLNTVLASRSFDPFPFILLNLALSCVAAIQAPIIMMSQNRQSAKDRAHAENDYQVNLKSEIILEDLHHKIDDIIANQEALLERMKGK